MQTDTWGERERERERERDRQTDRQRERKERKKREREREKENVETERIINRKYGKELLFEYLRYPKCFFIHSICEEINISKFMPASCTCT